MPLFNIFLPFEKGILDLMVTRIMLVLPYVLDERLIVCSVVLGYDRNISKDLLFSIRVQTVWRESIMQLVLLVHIWYHKNHLRGGKNPNRHCKTKIDEQKKRTIPVVLLNLIRLELGN